MAINNNSLWNSWSFTCLLVTCFQTDTDCWEDKWTHFYAQVISIGRVMQMYTRKDIGFISLKFYYLFFQGLISLINLTINFNLPLCL